MKDQPDDPLLRDLNRVLKYEFQFSGTFALSMVVPSCPNPGLDVDGVGRVALPLTDHTANLIASAGERAPCGRGMGTILRTTVRDAIEIDASNIRFTNPKWAPAIQECVEKEVWSGLGCAPFTSPPRCELHKLLLYKPGTHFSPHQDTEKAPGMFATLVVVLPSEFTGGEIHVSHGGENKVFDNGKDSAFETTILAWYTDVTHEVKEITSGYRLALSYCLINGSPGVDAPHLPNGDSGLRHLREILHKWSHDEYPSSKVNGVVAYALTHPYDGDASLHDVIIKGQGQYIASILKQAGDLEGVLVLMGRLDVYVTGSTGRYGWETYDGDEDSPEYGLATGALDTAVMSRVSYATVCVNNVQDTRGRGVRIAEIGLDGGSILPFRAFSGVRPDESEITEGWRAASGSAHIRVGLRYRCPALIMFPKKRQLSVVLSSKGGEDSAFEELEKSKFEGPSKENREIIKFLAKPWPEELLDTILRIAIEWDDAAVWSCVVKQNPKFFLKQKGYTSLCDGWEAFKFDGVCPTFEVLFQAHGWSQSESIKFLLFVKEKLPFGTDPKKDEWISAQATHVMETLAPLWEKSDELVPGVINIVRWRGLQFASSVILPRFQDNHSLDLLVDFGVSLVSYKEELVAPPRTEGQTGNAELLGHILDKILAVAVPQVSRPGIYHRVSPLLSICIHGNKMKSYEDLLDLISRPGKVPFYTQYLKLHARIIPDLVKLLDKHDISVSSSPSRKFFCYIIGTYLQEVLGSKEGSPCLKSFMLTCGHEACSRVNDFLRSEKRETSFPLGNTIPDCVSDLQINGRNSILSHGVYLYPNPPRIDLIKRDDAVATRNWSIRLADAQKLLRTIGTNEEVSQIMGERYQDVVKALEGSQAFVIAETRREVVDEAVVGM